MKNLAKTIAAFESLLREEEKQPATIEKYLRDVRAFCTFIGASNISKDTVVDYKSELLQKFKPAGVNSRLVAINRFLGFIGKSDCRVKLLKIQRQIFACEEKELSTVEYRRLISAAGRSRISYILQTICGTGIRVSELKYVTAEAVQNGKAVVNCKGKVRVIFFTKQIRAMLLEYMKKTGIKSGSLFVTKAGKPIDRTNIWREMKALCEHAKVSKDKVFPHNLRHLFARIFYSIEKDVVRLADILGHSSIETTRIYTIETGNIHIKSLERVSKSFIAT